ncbi:MAG: hypothetical protein HYS13_23525 [Planctomycetia bacterium]|nr:hypothetical protein [Planctomycetia bacterium]
MQHRWIDPEHAAFVARHKLDDLDGLLARADGQLVTPLHRQRETMRLDIALPGGTPFLVLKREPNVGAKDLLRRALQGHGLWTPPRAEMEILRKLRDVGVHCPRPIACVQRVGWRSQGCLVTAGLAGVQLVSAYLARPLRQAESHVRESLFEQLGQETARLHDAGVFHRRLFANNVYVQTGDGPPTIGFFDFRHGHLVRSLPNAKRAWDLASLLSTISRRLATPHQRHALLDAYLHESDLVHCGMELIALVEKDVEELLKLRRIWEIRESDTDTHLAVRPLDSVETGRMWIDRQFRPSLESAGIDTFDRIMGTKEGRCLRALPDRENWRIEIHAAHKPRCGAYLKKHHVRDWATWLRAKVGAGPGSTAGRIEAQNIARLSRSGIAAMRLISYGEKLHADGLLESFVLTEELIGFTQLDHFLKLRFSLLKESGNRPDHDLLRLIREVADVAAKLHKLGYNHRDLYCCHFFILEEEPGQFKVNLIDLQRIEHRKHFRSRWLVKDLAQLSYSAPRNRISCTHRMRFIKHYLGVRKLRPEDKRFIRRILAKQRWMERTIGIAG